MKIFTLKYCAVHGSPITIHTLRTIKNNALSFDLSRLIVLASFLASVLILVVVCKIMLENNYTKKVKWKG